MRAALEGTVHHSEILDLTKLVEELISSFGSDNPAVQTFALGVWCERRSSENCQMVIIEPSFCVSGSYRMSH